MAEIVYRFVWLDRCGLRERVGPPRYLNIGEALDTCIEQLLFDCKIAEIFIHSCQEPPNGEDRFPPVSPRPLVPQRRT